MAKVIFGNHSSVLVPHLIDEGYSQMRRYTPRLLEAFAFKAAPVAQS